MMGDRRDACPICGAERLGAEPRAMVIVYGCGSAWWNDEPAPRACPNAQAAAVELRKQLTTVQAERDELRRQLAASR